MELNDEQNLAVHHPEGSPAVVVAGAGSGKTRVLQERVTWLISQGVDPKKILAITFTNKAAGEILARVYKALDKDPNDKTFRGPRISTVHALALSAIRKDPTGFGLDKRISTLDEYDAVDLLQKMMERDKIEGLKPWNFLEKISYHRARGVGFSPEYTTSVHEAAMKAHGGYHALTDDELKLWVKFEAEKKARSVIDFDDMLHLVVRRGLTDEKWRQKLQGQWSHMLIDETQDSNKVQWDFFNLLLHPDNYNAFCVGDPSQCQPPETLVTVVDQEVKGGGRIGRGCTPTTYKQVRIDSLRDGDKVVSWRRCDCRTRATGRKIRVASRPYAGQLCRIETTAGTTRMTPNHWVWTRFNDNADGKYFLYLMYKEGLGYRVGVTKAKRANSGYGLSSRLNVERGDAAWILKVLDTKADADAWKEIYSLKYGIPESVFYDSGRTRKTQKHIELIFSYASSSGVLKCLEDHGLLINQPLVSAGQCLRGYFKTAAANVLPKIMDLPIRGINKFSRIENATREFYTGSVYSLDVEEDHTYIADDLVVGNSIYGFNGAAPELLLQFTNGWRGRETSLYKLERNHRSVPEVVKLANVVQKKMTATVPLQMISHRGEEGERGSTKILRASSPKEIAGSIAESIWHHNQLKRDRIAFGENAILVRSSQQIRDLETELVRWRVPYIIRGGRGLLQTEEAKDLLAYLKLATNPKDLIAFSRAISVPKRGFGDAAIEKVRKLAETFGGDLIRGSIKYGHARTSLWNQFMLELQEMTADPLAALDAVIRFTKYETLIKERYGKDSDKVETKIGNLNRLREMIEGILTVNTDASLEDVCFQLTLHASGESENEDGVAVITTIHACVDPSTLVETPAGLAPISDIPEVGSIATPTGMKTYVNKVTNAQGPALRIVTTGGYEVIVTPTHGMTSWHKDDGLVRVEAQDLREGDWLRLRLGSVIEPPIQNLPPAPTAFDIKAKPCRIPTVLTEDVAEFLGLIVGDGVVYKRGCRLMKQRRSVVERFIELSFNLFGLKSKIKMGHRGRIPFAEINSTYLASWLLAIGGLAPNEKYVPVAILQSPINVQAAFLRGLFEDGTIKMRADGLHVDHIDWGNKTTKVVQTVQTMLLRLGITSTRKCRAGQKFYSHLYLRGSNIERFRKIVAGAKIEKLLNSTYGDRNHAFPLTHEEISLLKPGLSRFSIQNGQQRGYLSKKIVRAALSRLPAPPDFVIARLNDWHYERISSIEPVMGPSMCVEVPDGSRFLQNGFDGWNSKGLEWKRCFVTNCYEGSIPHQYARTPNEVEEERRLLYVAITRARDECVLCIPSMIQYGPNTRAVDQSRFITEIMPK